MDSWILIQKKKKKKKPDGCLHICWCEKLMDFLHSEKLVDSCKLLEHMVQIGLEKNFEYWCKTLKMTIKFF